MDLVYAMGTGPGGADPAGGALGGGMLGSLLPLLLMFLVFYILLIRPQQKRAKQHKELLSSLKKGDEVVTSGGILGKVTGITENVVTLEVADKVRIKVQRGNISGMKPKPVADKTG
jgi:preprotein translocase subunit YajC